MNVYQFWHWSKQIQSLVDKLMSRNYAEYVQTQAIAQPPSLSVKLPSEEEDEEEAILRELNGVFGA